MPTFRLFHVRSHKLQAFDLCQPPEYLAISHAWSENIFPPKTVFDESSGGLAIQRVITTKYPKIAYCWFDNLCIDQQDENDKLIQIPLMDQIYSKATAVAIVVSADLGMTQDVVDKTTKGLQGALAMCTEEAWVEEGQFWKEGAGLECIKRCMRGLSRIAQTTWASRIWTLQEYILAKKVVWVGKSLDPLIISDEIFHSVPMICLTLQIEECLGQEYSSIYSHLEGMATTRCGAIDRTRIMELLGNRRATVEVDEVYGVMAASGIIIQPVAGEDKVEAWRRWWEKAVLQGHLRWTLLPSAFGVLNEGEIRNCVIPEFNLRHKLSSCSGLDTVKALGPIQIDNNGTVKLFAREIGQVTIVRRLGRVHEPQKGTIHRDVTLILFAQAKWSLAIQIVAAFGAGRYNRKQILIIAQVLVRSYGPAIRAIARKRESELKPVITSALQLHVWSDFMMLQMAQMPPMNESVAYLCRLSSNHLRQPITTVLVSGDSISRGKLKALDFEAMTPSERFPLMVVQSTGSENLHKAGMTLPISANVAKCWASEPLAVFPVGGRECSVCKSDNFTTNIAGVYSSGMQSPITRLSKDSSRRIHTLASAERNLAYLRRKLQNNRLEDRLQGMPKIHKSFNLVTSRRANRSVETLRAQARALRGNILQH